MGVLTEPLITLLQIDDFINLLVNKKLVEYDLELEKAVNEIKSAKARIVLIQLPDGLKPKAAEIADYLQENTNTKIFIWLQSCWGSCDYPEIRNIDLLIQFGHARPSILTPRPG